MPPQDGDRGQQSGRHDHRVREYWPAVLHRLSPHL